MPIRILSRSLPCPAALDTLRHELIEALNSHETWEREHWTERKQSLEERFRALENRFDRLYVDRDVFINRIEENGRRIQELSDRAAKFDGAMKVAAAIATGVIGIAGLIGAGFGSYLGLH